MANVNCLIFVALKNESVPLLKRYNLTPDADAPSVAWRGVFFDRRVAVVVTGVGRANVDRVAPDMMLHYMPERVLICGTVGALDPALEPAQLVIPALVIDAATGKKHTPTLAMEGRGTLVTCEKPVAAKSEKALLRQRYNADAVDMESAPLAELCTEEQVPWGVIRGVLDTAHQSLPRGLARLTRDDGGVRGASTARYILTHPWQLARLSKLGATMRRAMAAVAERIIPVM